MKGHVIKLLGAGAVSLAAMGASAPALADDIPCLTPGLDQCYGGEVSSGGTFDIGSLSVSMMSDVFGFLATDALNVASMTLTNNGNSVMSANTAEGFAFDDLASGNYTVSITADLTGLTGSYNGGLRVVPQIPEPETFALMLAGLATLGALTRRRAKG